jgi:hypothetical protein
VVTSATWVAGLAVLAGGCSSAVGDIASPASVDQAGFACSGPQRAPLPDDTLSPAADVPIGAVEVRLLGDPPAERSCGTLDDMQIAVLADAVPLASVGVHLAQATGIAVVVDWTVVPLRVGFAAGQTSVRGFLDALGRDYDVSSTCEDGLLHLGGLSRLLRRQEARYCPPPLQTRLVRVEPPEYVVPLARLFCETIASDRGSASVVGSTIMLTDERVVLDLAEQLFRAVLDSEDAEVPSPPGTLVMSPP